MSMTRRHFIDNNIILVVLLLFICSFIGCGRALETADYLDEYPAIFPDYMDVTIPVNIAPLNFCLQDNSERIHVRFVHNGQTLLKCNGRRKIDIPLRVWKNMLQRAAGSSLQTHVYAKYAGKWYAYRQFDIHVATDSIDPWIAYRLIEPGYEVYSNMGIYQRNLSNFDCSPIIHNKLTNESCVNCHSFHNYNPDRMMFHSRGESAGTFLLADGKQYRVNTRTEHSTGNGSYPAWHPSGDYIAFSVNSTRQSFHALPGKRIDVFDWESNLAVWDVKNKNMILDARFNTKNEWETFPTWSPDGKWLYFCRAEEKNVPLEIKELKYGLYRVDFDAETGRFGNRVDTILNPGITGKSVSFPRISPDGRYLLYTSAGYGTFPIWHAEADLEMLDLNDFSNVDIQIINSDDTESYHSWSSNGRWLTFSSRRGDGLYTRLYFAYFDEAGRISKPFLFPQKNPEEDITLLLSYNIPEFIKGKVELNAYETGKTLNGEKTNLNEIY